MGVSGEFEGDAEEMLKLLLGDRHGRKLRGAQSEKMQARLSKVLENTKPYYGNAG